MPEFPHIVINISVVLLKGHGHYFDFFLFSLFTCFICAILMIINKNLSVSIRVISIRQSSQIFVR